MQSIDAIIGKFIEIVINPIIFIGFTAAFIVFLWGIVEFLAQGNNPEKSANGKRHMIWGVVGLFIFVASIGIIRILSNTVSGPEVFEA